MSKIPATFNFTVVSGDDHFTRFEFKNIDANGVETIIDLTGYTVQFNAKRQKTNTDANRVLALTGADSELDVTDLVNGVVDFIPDATATAAFSFVNALYNMTFISGGSPTKTTTLVKGRLTIDRGV